MTIKKKIWPEYFQLVQSGKKKFEFRVADFEVKEGDVLVLEEWDPKTKEYTGRKIEKRVGYVSKFNLDSFAQRQELREYGFYILGLDDTFAESGPAEKFIEKYKMGIEDIKSLLKKVAQRG